MHTAPKAAPTRQAIGRAVISQKSTLVDVMVTPSIDGCAIARPTTREAATTTTSATARTAHHITTTQWYTLTPFRMMMTQPLARAVWSELAPIGGGAEALDVLVMPVLRMKSSEMRVVRMTSSEVAESAAAMHSAALSRCAKLS